MKAVLQRPLVVSYPAGLGSFFAEDDPEWFGELGATVVVVGETDLLEGRMVELAANTGASVEVRLGGSEFARSRFRLLSKR